MITNTQMESNLLTMLEAAKRLRIHRRTLEQYVRRGLVATVPIGRRRFVHLREILRIEAEGIRE